jgi:ABC-2 type transport system ATP-binding protein
MDDENLVTLNGLKIHRGEFTLDLPAWSVKPGQVVGVVGPNGAGKTTLLEALAGLLPTGAAGQVNVFGFDPWLHPSEVRLQLGFMSDDMAIFNMRIDRMLRLLSGYYPTWDADLVEQLLERFKLDPLQKTDKLSKGQGTRVRLVTAMAFKPRLLVLDEPASGLDLGGRLALLESIVETVRDPARTVIISSHAIQDVHRIADRLLIINEGQLVREGPTHDLVPDDRSLEEVLVELGAAG